MAETEINSPLRSRGNVVSPKAVERKVQPVHLGADREVRVGNFIKLSDYKAITPPANIAVLTALAKEFGPHRIIFFNSTPQGGGVALMRHALIRLYKLLHVDARWYVVPRKDEIFRITKPKFHNILQGISRRPKRLTQKEKARYLAWSERSARFFAEPIKAAQVIVIDDSQPSGMVPHIKRLNPEARVIFRSHIHLETKLINKEGTPQHDTWQFVWSHIKAIDLFVSHPVASFVPRSVPKEKVVLMPATTDPLDGLNQNLSDKESEYNLARFNRILVNSDQTPLDPARPYFIQIARFDPSKGIPDLIEAYRKLRTKCKGTSFAPPQLVIVGNGSVDDPEGLPTYKFVTNLIKKSLYTDIAHDIKIALLPHFDELLNALLRKSYAVLQLSHKEGFEVKVTEALMKGKPVIAYRAGGLPLQIQQGKTGYLVKPGDTDTVADYLYRLLTMPRLYERLSRAASHKFNPDVTTVSNAINWLFLANELLTNPKFKGNGKYIKDLIQEEKKN